MMRSLYAGVSGLGNHQTRMDVLGDNIANVNTYGFKKSRVTFKDLLYQTISGASEPREEKGGVNPRQIGLGMLVASTDKIMTQGSLQQTGAKYDVALYGDGFFIVNKGEESFYTRAGTFGVDRDGVLVNKDGLRVQGWAAEEIAGEAIINTRAPVGEIRLPIYGKDPAHETTEVHLRCNMDSDTPENAAVHEQVRVTQEIYDSLGATHRLAMVFTRVGVNQWQVEATVEDAANITANVVPSGVPPPADTPNDSALLRLDYDNFGRLVGLSDVAEANRATNAPTDAANVDELRANLQFTFPGNNDQVQNISILFGTAGEIRDTATQQAEDSTVTSYFQNGRSMGYLADVKIDESGVLTGVYSNGWRAPLAQMAVAVFTNQEGLDKAGSGLYEVTNNSGQALVGQAGVGGRGAVSPGMVEMSNVDMAEQFTDMIVTQRGFQANARVITTTDQMLQELLTLKR